jgi:hypothetical protein
MNAAYLQRCVDEERRAKIAAGFTMYATTAPPPPPITHPSRRLRSPFHASLQKTHSRPPTTRVLITATA